MVDGPEMRDSPVEQKVVNPIIYRVFPTSQVVGLGISEPSTVGILDVIVP